MTKNNLLTEQLNYGGTGKSPTRMQLYSYNPSGVVRQEGKCIADLLPSLRKDSINWILVCGLQNAEAVQGICEHFQIDFLNAQDLMNPEHLTKIEEHDTYNLVILKQLCMQNDHTYIAQQLGILQGTDYVLTFVEKDTDFFNDIVMALNKNVLKIRNRQSDFLLSVILNSVMASFMSIISAIEDDLEDMEESLLSPDENSPTIDDIQQYRRNIRLVKKSVLPLKESMNLLLHTDNNLLHKANHRFFSDVNDHLLFVLQTLEGCRDMVVALLDLYLSNNNQRMNNIMRQLTVVSTIFIPLTFLVGVWGMNFRNMPELQWHWGYLFAWLLMIILGVGIYFYFRHKKWN